MKIYLDLVIFINIFFDFVLLLGVKYILKRRTKLFRIIIGSVVGGFSIFFLFIPLNTFSLFLLKIIISIVMVLVTFGEKDFLKTYIYFYILSIFLGGVMYFLNLNFSYKNKGVVFFSNGLSINFIVMIIITPIIIYLYIKEQRKYKEKFSNCYEIDIYINNYKYTLTGYLDTGNTLKDPYKNRSVIITNSNKIKFDYENAILVPYKTISNSGLIKCLKVDKVIINGHEIRNCLIGKSDKMFDLNNSDCILPNDFKEELV